MAVSELERAKADLLAPLRELHKTAESEVVRLQKELDAAKKTKREIQQLLRGVDPEFPNPYAKNGKKKVSGARLGKYSDEKIEAVGSWLQEHKEELNQLNNGAGFYGSQLVPEYVERGLPVNNQSAIASVLIDLRERGLVRLSKRGGMGGRKYYKVV